MHHFSLEYGIHIIVYGWHPSFLVVCNLHDQTRKFKHSLDYILFCWRDLLAKFPCLSSDFYLLRALARNSIGDRFHWQLCDCELFLAISLTLDNSETWHCYIHQLCSNIIRDIYSVTVFFSCQVSKHFTKYDFRELHLCLYLGISMIIKLTFQNLSFTVHSGTG